jgi:alditol oxidase
MNKRTFLKLLSATATCSPSRALLALSADSKLTNWAGNIEYSTGRLYEASGVEQVRDIVKSRNKLKALGTRHCFNRIADSRDGLFFVELHERDDCARSSRADRVGRRRYYVRHAQCAATSKHST